MEFYPLSLPLFIPWLGVAQGGVIGHVENVD